MVARRCRLKIMLSICTVSLIIRCCFFIALSFISKNGCLCSWYIRLEILFIMRSCRFSRLSLISLKQVFKTQTQFMYSISIWNVNKLMITLDISTKPKIIVPEYKEYVYANQKWKKNPNMSLACINLDIFWYDCWGNFEEISDTVRSNRIYGPLKM